MGYFEITGKVEEVDESSYTRKGANGTEETVSKIQLALVVPGMQDRVRCELPLELAPKPETLEKWEMDEVWVVVSADSMRALAFARSNARPGEKAVGALVIFPASEVREVSGEERKRLQERRRAQKVQAKQRRAARAAEREAAKAQTSAAAVQSA
jgi:hypothetical protein